jgi:GT2 family glycosyltransferase
MNPTCDIVVPTVGRPSLHPLLWALAEQVDAGPTVPARPRVIVVDDRTRPDGPLLGPTAPCHAPTVPCRPSVEVVQSGGRGPAAARNVGWRRSFAQWVAFVDDDVMPGDRWWLTLLADIGRAGPGIGGVQGRIVVPGPEGRRATDHERNVGGLADARWATADMAYRRTALAVVGGFDDRFRRAYREDADLALRIRRAGFGLMVGDRHVVHPVGAAPWWASVARQRGNADDALMRRVHGARWRVEAEAPPGAYRAHLVASVGLAAAVVGASARRPRMAGVGALVWSASLARFAWRRIVLGPRTPGEIAAMVATSVAIPVVAVWHRAAGAWRFRAAEPWDRPSAARLTAPVGAGHPAWPHTSSVANAAGDDGDVEARPAASPARTAGITSDTVR